jgi:carbon-monoxide dehydrogenase small subunit
MKQIIKIMVNGEDYEKEVAVHKSLLDFLRDDLSLTGTKKGCDNADCGSCTVLLDGKPVISCIMLAVEADGCEILTIEGMAAGRDLHPVQSAFVESGAVQCGFCTPGMVLSAKVLLDENPEPSESEIRQTIAGHLCRCTGYDQIVKGIQKAADHLNANGKTSKRKS